MHLRTTKRSGYKLDICCQFQWETQGKTCSRWFSHSRPCGEHLFRSTVPEALNTCHIPWEAQHLRTGGVDIGNAYLEAYTHEKLFIIAGAEFEELEGFILVFNKALYGLKSSGKRWGEMFHDIIKDMGFMPSKADPCVWMRENKELKCYEYIATYDDDLCIAAQDQARSFKSSRKTTNLRSKEMDP